MVIDEVKSLPLMITRTREVNFFIRYAGSIQRVFYKDDLMVMVIGYGT